MLLLDARHRERHHLDSSDSYIHVIEHSIAVFFSVFTIYVLLASPHIYTPLELKLRNLHLGFVTLLIIPRLLLTYRYSRRLRAKCLINIS